MLVGYILNIAHQIALVAPKSMSELVGYYSVLASYLAAFARAAGSCRCEMHSKSGMCSIEDYSGKRRSSDHQKSVRSLMLNHACAKEIFSDLGGGHRFHWNASG